MNANEMKDNELEMVTGGTEEKIRYQYHVGQSVVGKKTGFVMYICELYGWSKAYNCPDYRTIILSSKDPNYPAGATYFIAEVNIEGEYIYH